jgi:fucose permease
MSRWVAQQESVMKKSLAGKLNLSLILAFSSFIALGLVAGLLGVAWPSIRATFGLPLDAVVALLITSTIGFVVGSILASQIMIRIGVGVTLLASNILAAGGLLGYAIAPEWWVVVLLGLLTGAAAGLIDTGLNIYVAANHGVTYMNWMHACFGIGATLGPLLMTAVLGFGLSWRYGYGVAAALHFVLGIGFLFSIGHQSIRSMTIIRPQETSEAIRSAKPLDTLRKPIVWLSILLFLLYTGIESTTGQWSFSLFTESRSITPYLAGVLTSLFWGMLTLGRFVLGAAARLIGVERLLRISMLGVVIAAVLFLFQTTLAGFFAVSLMGFSLSAIFPTLTSDTPHRVGQQHAPNTIGFQTGSASIGFAVLPGLAGVLAERIGLESLGPFLILLAILMLLTNEIIVRVLRQGPVVISSTYSKLTGD